MNPQDTQSNILNELVEDFSKEIKDEEENIKQILLTMFSAWTDHPQNTRILAPSGEGKTYLVTKLSKLFPQENIIMLAKATPQSFKYNLSKKVVENGSGVIQEYDVAIKPLEEELKNAKTKEEKEEISSQIRELQDSTCDLIDYTQKIIILVDSQSQELFESIKTTLSHDQQTIKSFGVNKSQSGMIQGQKFVTTGFPAVIYCSAKDEQKYDVTDEISTRFNTISLNTSPVKYRKMLELEGISSSLPDSIYQEEIISDDELLQLRTKILDVIDQIKYYGKPLNPYGLGLQKLFKNDGGFRTRQLKILNSNILVHTLIHANNRPQITYNNETSLISTMVDVKEACALVKESKEIQPYKIKFFNDYIRPAILEIGRQRLPTITVKCMTASDLAEHISKIGRTTDRQKLQESFLRPLTDHGFLEEFQDPDNKTRNVYTLATRFEKNLASLESTLIDISMLDDSCLNSFIEKFIKHRYDSGNLEILDKNNEKISLQELVEILNEIDVSCIENMPKTSTIEMQTNIDGFGDV